MGTIKNIKLYYTLLLIILSLNTTIVSLYYWGNVSAIWTYALLACVFLCILSLAYINRGKEPFNYFKHKILNLLFEIFFMFNLMMSMMAIFIEEYSFWKNVVYSLIWSVLVSLTDNYFSNKKAKSTTKSKSTYQSRQHN